MLLMALECISVCVWTGDVRALSHIYAKLLVLEFTVDDNMKNTFAEKMSWHISHKPSWWFNNFYPPLRQYHSVDAVARSEMVMERLRPRSDRVRDARKCWCIKDGSDSVLLPPPVQQWCSAAAPRCRQSRSLGAAIVQVQRGERLGRVSTFFSSFYFLPLFVHTTKHNATNACNQLLFCSVSI